MPPIIAYHVIFSTYGFWLPNDPRGSGSSAVWAKHLRRFGPPTKVATRRSVAALPHDRSQRRAAKSALLHPAINLTGRQALSVSQGIAEVATNWQLPIYAAALMPDHVHLVIARRKLRAEDWTWAFQAGRVEATPRRRTTSVRRSSRRARPIAELLGWRRLEGVSSYACRDSPRDRVR